MSNWVGYAVSVNCGETLGCYQGTILEANGTTITLTKAFRNGFPYPKSQVTLNAVDIKDLRIIEERSERAETHSTVAVAPARRSRATVCETLQANPGTGNCTESNNASSSSKPSTGSNSNQSGQPPARSKPVDIVASRNKSNNNAGSQGSGSTPTRRRGEPTGLPGSGRQLERARQRNLACFGDHADEALADDFDFEGNLALFDKRAVWASIGSSKPDVVRTAYASKYRHDENVLGGAPPGAPAGGPPCCALPAALHGGMEYVTDEGCVVPAVSGALRRRLWEGLQRHGLADFALAMVARAACDVALRLVGGGRRLEPRNAHQAPRVVCLAGAHRGGAAGLCAARLLAARGARPHVHVLGAAPACAQLQRELAALALDGVRPAALAALPAPDLVLVALHDPLSGADSAGAGAEAALRWARAARAAALLVEPAPAGGGAALEARAAVLGGAAVALAPALGRVFLADVAAPRALFDELRVRYNPPFGALPVLPLHPRLD